MRRRHRRRRRRRHWRATNRIPAKRANGSAVKYSRTIGEASRPSQDFLPALNGYGENGCILTTHTLIVNPVSGADRAPYRGKGSSLNLFIRIPEAL